MRAEDVVDTAEIADHSAARALARIAPLNRRREIARIGKWVRIREVGHVHVRERRTDHRVDRRQSRLRQREVAYRDQIARRLRRALVRAIEDVHGQRVGIRDGARIRIRVVARDAIDRPSVTDGILEADCQAAEPGRDVAIAPVDGRAILVRCIGPEIVIDRELGDELRSSRRSERGALGRVDSDNVDVRDCRRDSIFEVFKRKSRSNRLMVTANGSNRAAELEEAGNGAHRTISRCGVEEVDLGSQLFAASRRR